MQRRHFLANALGAGSLACTGGLGEGAVPGARSQGAAQEITEPADGQRRFEALAKALDREAMQHGWATDVAPGYRHAPESAIEAFKDLKFGIRIHWGLYCMIGSDASWALAGADRRFWDNYNVLYQFFNPTHFDADEWMDLFGRGGAKYFTFTTKHHDGFCLWPTETRHESIKLTPKGFSFGGVEHYEKVRQAYSIMDGPYKKDIVRSVVEAGRKSGMGVGLYYSHVDWHDPAFAWDPFNREYDPSFTPESDPERWRTFIEHERIQLQELMTHYGKIDYLDFDIGWPKAAAEAIAGLAVMVRGLQPAIIMRDRGIGAYGDYHTPERQVPSDSYHGIWKVIYPCGEAFSYLPNDIYKPPEWILENLIGITAKGGNFEVGFGPMPNGRWPEETVERLEYVGAWLGVNGNAIYGTRPRKDFREGEKVWFTRSKSGEDVYAIHIGWPGDRLEIQTVRAVPGSQIFMLGVEKPLAWRQNGQSLVIEIPQSIAAHPPCKHAFAFKIKAQTA